ncbi:NmrA family NAD(P)-binding protein [Streptomyces sp. NPDC058964]|uniref:NmrA family NAD(P)-binding protein n=1 Tax=Streptomyces sp. NPDC058964 TaxID=3346681 RepID=UPI0036C1DE6E
MPPTSKIAFVAGAAGQQAGATARRLLAGGWRVRALVRNPAAPAAPEPARLGAELVRGRDGRSVPGCRRPGGARSVRRPARLHPARFRRERAPAFGNPQRYLGKAI